MEEQELKSRPKTQSLTYFTGVDSLRIPDHLHLTTIAPKLEAIGRWYLVKTLQMSRNSKHAYLSSQDTSL